MTRELWDEFKSNNRRSNGATEDQGNNPYQEATVNEIIYENFSELEST